MIHLDGIEFALDHLSREKQGILSADRSLLVTRKTPGYLSTIVWPTELSRVTSIKRKRSAIVPADRGTLEFSRRVSTRMRRRVNNCLMRR